MKRLTIRQAHAILAPLGLTFGKTPFGEYRVAFIGDPESAYYGSEIQETVDTGLAMAKRLKDREAELHAYLFPAEVNCNG